MKIEIVYSGISRSDPRHARTGWRDSLYPMVSGHELCAIPDKVITCCQVARRA